MPNPAIISTTESQLETFDEPSEPDSEESFTTSTPKIEVNSEEITFSNEITTTESNSEEAIGTSGILASEEDESEKPHIHYFYRRYFLPFSPFSRRGIKMCRYCYSYSSFIMPCDPFLARMIYPRHWQ